MILLRAAVVCLLAVGFIASPAVAETSPPPDLPDSAVSVPWSDFKTILEKLMQTQTDPPVKPPRAGILANAEYEAVVQDEVVRLTIFADALVLEEREWADIPVVRLNTPIAEASLDGKAVSLADGRDGYLHLAVRGAGAHELVLRMELPLGEGTGPGRFTLPGLRSHVNRLRVRLPEGNMVVSASTGRGISSRNADGGTIAETSFSQTDSVAVSWTRRAEVSPRADARVSAEVRTMVTVGEGLAVYTSIIDYTIQHKPISKFSVELPSDVVLADVSTDGLVDWNVEKTGGGQRVLITIAYEALGPHRVALTFEQSLAAKDDVTFTTADLKVDNVVHELGYLAVAVRTNVQVTAADTENLAPLDVSELPGDLRGAGDATVLFGYKYIKHPNKASLAVVRHEDASVLGCAVEDATYRIMLTDRGKELLEANFVVKNRTKQFLTVTLPEGMDVWSVHRDGQPIKAARDGDALLLPIARTDTYRPTRLSLMIYRESGFTPFLARKTFELPTLDVPTNRISLTTYVPPGYRYFGFGGTLDPERIRPMPRESFEASTDGLGTFGGGAGMESADEKKADVDKLGGDLEELDDARRYRNEQSQAASNIASGPAFASNAAYFGALTKGSLPIAVQVDFTGIPIPFAGRIVDPGEKPYVTMAYNTRVGGGLWRLVATLLLIYFGYVATRRLIGRRTGHQFRLPLTRRQHLFVALVLGLLAFFVGLGGDAVFSGAFFGIVIALAQVALTWLWRKEQTRRAAKAEAATVAEPVTNEPVDPPAEGDE
ncbi:hypothetical protein KDL45_01810 [bacterium]|nr:hypothetical protein [bacterium]